MVLIILENFDEAESFGYWQVSDFNDEVKADSDVYHGGQGIYTYNGIKKSHYYVFKMLNKLGSVLIEKGDGYFITTDGSAIQIMLYNYQHYSRLYASGELFDMDFKDRYTPFQNSYILKIIIPLINLSSCRYQITETIINKQYGSSFDKWIEGGAYHIESREDVEYLKQASIPKIQKRMADIEDGSLKIAAELKPHEVRFVELRPIE